MLPDLIGAQPSGFFGITMEVGTTLPEYVLDRMGPRWQRLKKNIFSNWRSTFDQELGG